MTDLDLTDAAAVAYRGWREAQRGNPLQPGEFEATFSRVEAEWMAKAVRAVAPLIAAQVRAQIAADIEALATAAESKRDEHREIAISYLAKSDQRIRHMATALAFRNQADGLRTAEMVARGDT